MLLYSTCFPPLKIKCSISLNVSVTVLLQCSKITYSRTAVILWGSWYWLFGIVVYKLLSPNNIQIIEFLLECDESFLRRLPNINNAACLNKNKIKTIETANNTMQWFVCLSLYLKGSMSVHKGMMYICVLSFHCYSTLIVYYQSTSTSSVCTSSEICGHTSGGRDKSLPLGSRQTIPHPINPSRHISQAAAVIADL